MKCFEYSRWTKRLATVSEVEGHVAASQGCDVYSKFAIRQILQIETNCQKGPQGMSMTATTNN
jgi:hypothetical protein